MVRIKLPLKGLGKTSNPILLSGFSSQQGQDVKVR